MFITIINDCKSQNDIARQCTRWAALFPNTNIAFVGVDSSLGINATIEAAGNLVDTIDAAGGENGIISLNVAPRGQTKEDGANGSSFCYFWIKKTLIVSTVKAYNLSLVKKLQLTKFVHILDTVKVLEYAYKKNLISKSQKNYITKSQFRSFDFQPRVSKWIIDGHKIPNTKLNVNKFPDIPDSIWLIDSFGNIKLTITKNDLPSKPSKIKTNYGIFKYYNRLKNVPDGETAIYTGSSGAGNTRFLEIATQNRYGSAAKNLNLKVGDEIKSIVE